MSRLVSRSDLARLAGVSKAAITKAAKAQFSEACVGQRIDLDHEKVLDYLARKGVAPTPAPILDTTSPFDPTTRRPASPASDDPGPSREPPPRTRPAPTHSETPLETVSWDDIERYAHLSLHALVAKFGTATVFEDWLDARKTISDIREKDLKNDALAGRLISRELVQTHVFGAIETANRRILGDGAAAIAKAVFAVAKNGGSVDDAEKAVRAILRDHLEPVKATAARVLRGDPRAGDDARAA